MANIYLLFSQTIYRDADKHHFFYNYCA